MERDKERNSVISFCICSGSGKCNNDYCYHHDLHEYSHQDSCGTDCSVYKCGAGTRCVSIYCLFVEEEMLLDEHN